MTRIRIAVAAALAIVVVAKPLLLGAIAFLDVIEGILRAALTLLGN